MHNYGTIHLYGIDDSVTDATISDQSFDHVCANIGEVVGETGNVIQRRYDDITITGTVTLILRSGFSLPTPGDTFDVDSTTYEITGLGRKKTARGFRILEVRVKKSEFVAYS